MELQYDPERLRARIKAKGFTLRSFSHEVGWSSHGYLNKLLAGEAKTMRTDPALRMAYLLDLPLDVLFVTRVSTNSAPAVGRTRTQKAHATRRKAAVA